MVSSFANADELLVRCAKYAMCIAYRVKLSELDTPDDGIALVPVVPDEVLKASEDLSLHISDADERRRIEQRIEKLHSQWHSRYIACMAQYGV